LKKKSFELLSLSLTKKRNKIQMILVNLLLRINPNGMKSGLLSGQKVQVKLQKGSYFDLQKERERRTLRRWNLWF